MKRHLWIPGVVLFAIAVGCGAPPTPGAQPEQTPPAQPTPPPLIKIPEEAEELGWRARAALAERLKQADEAIEFIDVEPAEWPTAAMGCPEPDKAYAQVVTTGYVVRLKAGDKTFEVHISKDGQVVFCNAGEKSRGEESREMQVPEDARPAAMAAKRDLASRVGVGVEEVQIVEFQAVEWPDSSLGCPEPGKMYLQVIMPGYRVVLKAAGQTYEYHTDRGNRVVLCEKRTAGTASQKPRLEEFRDVVERARNDLAQRLEIEPADIVVAEALLLSQVEQPAPCPEADQLAGAGTEYQVLLQAEGETYTYRARGETVVLCTQ